MNNLNFQPTLIGELLELRPLKPTDFAALYNAAKDPLIWEQHPESNRYQIDIFRRYFDSAIASKGAFAIIERKTGRIIGSSRYYNFKPEQSEIEIGWTFLERAYWGGKYNSELKSLMIDYAFQFVEQIAFVIGANNLRSQMAIKKLGAEFVKTIEEDAKVVFVLKRKNVIAAG
jgi:RimJ/RimL family protein N-acetyltransferase